MPAIDDVLTEYYRIADEVSDRQMYDIVFVFQQIVEEHTGRDLSLPPAPSFDLYCWERRMMERMSIHSHGLDRHLRLQRQWCVDALRQLRDPVPAPQ